MPCFSFWASYHLRSSGLKDLIYGRRIDESEATQACDSAYVKANYEKEKYELAPGSTRIMIRADCASVSMMLILL